MAPKKPVQKRGPQKTLGDGNCLFHSTAQKYEDPNAQQRREKFANDLTDAGRNRCFADLDQEITDYDERITWGHMLVNRLLISCGENIPLIKQFFENNEAVISVAKLVGKEAAKEKKYKRKQLREALRPLLQQSHPNEKVNDNFVDNDLQGWVEQFSEENDIKTLFEDFNNLPDEATAKVNYLLNSPDFFESYISLLKDQRYYFSFEEAHLLAIKEDFCLVIDYENGKQPKVYNRKAEREVKIYHRGNHFQGFIKAPEIQEDGVSDGNAIATP